jgi:hypothetical protein
MGKYLTRSKKEFVNRVAVLVAVSFTEVAV